MWSLCLSEVKGMVINMQYHIIDVFTDKLFGGNPAGVCVLDAWIADDVMQNIAAENNLSETAFLVKQDGYYDLRWFTPEVEVDLCGHATAASAFVLFDEIEKDAEEIKFKTMSGMMAVAKRCDTASGKDLLYLDFPSRPVAPCPMYPCLESSFGIKPVAVYRAADILVLVDNEETLLSINPDLSILNRIKSEAGMDNDSFGVIVTAKGSDCDFVSRFFAPNAGISEDPVTGRAHCSLIPFWGERLGKKIMTARQLSKRGGVIFCEDHGERVKIGGNAVRYLRGDIRAEGI
jgi:predicted PhzF superfamily epimerase YddE/YHI9